MSGTEFARTKEAQAAIMRAKQEAGMIQSSNLIVNLKANKISRAK